MKALTTLLALMTLFLSSQTCCLEDEDHCGEGEHTSQNCSDQPEKQHRCLPFFSCGACFGFTPSQYDSFLAFFPELVRQTRLSNLSQLLPDYIPTELIKPPSFWV